jgi:pimeloyl-ACP methyl ester carboxylesterase
MACEQIIAGVPVYVQGDGPQTILMLHGWPDTHRLWDRQVAFFSQHHRCVTMTLPGFGEPGQPRGYSLDHVISVIEQVVGAISPNQKVTLLLHDWGCPFGYQFAMLNPERVARIVAIDVGDANSLALRRSLSPLAKGMIFTYQITLALAWTIGGAIGNGITRGVAKALQAKADLRHVHAGMNYPYAMRWLNALGGLDALRQVEPECPFFYAYARQKPFMFHSPQWVQRLAGRKGNVVQGFDSGHWVMVDCAEEFNAAVAAWLSASSTEEVMYG